jgi:hypothetical protein
MTDLRFRGVVRQIQASEAKIGQAEPLDANQTHGGR